MNDCINEMYTLEWGDISVDAYDTKSKTATTVLNFNFESEENLENILSYSRDYIYWTGMNLPVDSTHTIIYDVRGLKVQPTILNKFEEELKNSLKKKDKRIKIRIVFNK